MDKKQRLTTITTFCLVLLFALLSVAYAVIKGPENIYASLDGETECNLQTGEGCDLEDQANDDVAGFYQPENISNYVDVPGVSGKLFGTRNRGMALSSFVPSGPTTLALLTTPIVTGGDDDDDEGGSGGTPQIQQFTALQCDAGFIECNGECIPAEEKCTEKEPEEEACDPQADVCEPTTTSTTDPNAVPEPATMLLFGAGLAGAAFRRKFAA